MTNIFHFVINFMLILDIRIQLSDESEFLVDRSEKGLIHVPKDLSLETAILNISYNYISEIQTSDILSLSKLRILIISHNRIQHVDITLDFSFNAFDVLPICKEFGNMYQLKFLGLSATQLEKYGVLPTAHLISVRFCGLESLLGKKESLQDFNTESLHIVFLMKKEFHFILDGSFSTVVNLELFNINVSNYLISKLSNINYLISNIICLYVYSPGFSPCNPKECSLHFIQNSLRYEENEGNCSWTKSFLSLNMSSNILTDSVFRCLPPRIKVLDLHSNRIERIPKDVTSLEALQELNVALNSLTDLPGCGAFSSLSVLIIDHNSVSQPSTDFFQSCQKVRSIKAGNNPFQCTCELREFVKNIGQVSSEVVEGWPDSYKCDYPESYRGTPLKDVHMSPLSCNTALLMVTIGATTLVLAVTVTFLCIYLDLPWYLRMVCQWTQTRHRARNIPLEELQRTLQFHAFISYSEHDSVWVKNELVPCLEKEDIRICLHERNFVPGKSIVENIINCIEKSYKSIFVLSPHFVQSEWCHYELYFAHHNLFHEGSDNLILILLEPIPQNIIPSKYHKLKALMAQRTYLEWPKEKSKRGLFWANLRAAINIKLMEQAKE
uniref:Toll-like receptor n=1 Tax=Microcebus murinus TaxID=30608 RepID=A0A8C5W0S6_MICMU